MLSDEEMIRLQAEKHDLIDPHQDRSKEGYVLHLMHEFDYYQAARLSANKQILDLGCNTGYGTKILFKSAQKIVGVDVSEKAISIATNQYGHLGIPFQLIDGKQLPFASNEFDMITSFQVIEHIVDYDLYIGELKKVLSHKGLVIFTTPNSILRLDPGMKPWNPFHVTEFDHSSLSSLLGDFFSQVKILGLFANEPLYSIEKNRLYRELENARQRENKSNASYYQNAFFSATKRMLPDSLLTKLKKIRPSSLPTTQLVDKDFTNAHGIENFFYRQNDLEAALTLVAVCSDDSSILEESVPKLLTQKS